MVGQGVHYFGNLTHDPDEITNPHTGNKGASFQFAHNSAWQDRATGEWHERPAIYFRVTCWGRLGVHVLQSIGKGDPVEVTGRLQPDAYLDREGVARPSLDIVADSVSIDLRDGVVGRFRRSRRQQAENPLGLPLDGDPRFLTSESTESADGASGTAAEGGEDAIGTELQEVLDGAKERVPS